MTFDQNGDADLTTVDIYSIGGLLKLFLVSKKVISQYNSYNAHKMIELKLINSSLQQLNFV